MVGWRLELPDARESGQTKNRSKCIFFKKKTTPPSV